MKWIWKKSYGDTVAAAIFATSFIISPVLSEELPVCADFKSKDFCDAFQKIENWRTFQDDADFALVRSISQSAPDEIRYFATFWLIKNLISLKPEFFQSKRYYNDKIRLILQLSSYQHATNDNQRPQAYLHYLFQIMEPVSTLRISDYEFDVQGYQFSEENLRYIECFVLKDIPFLKASDFIQLDTFKRCLERQ